MKKKKPKKIGRPRLRPGEDGEAGMLVIRMCDEEAKAVKPAAAAAGGLPTATWARMLLLDAKPADGQVDVEAKHPGGRKLVLRVPLNRDQRSRVDALAAAAKMETSTWARAVLLSAAGRHREKTTGKV